MEVVQIPGIGLVVAAIHLTRAVTGKDTRDSRKLLSDSLASNVNETRAKAAAVLHRKHVMPGFSPDTPTWVVTFEEALSLVCDVLPGKYTAGIRQRVQSVFQRVQAGDQSVHAEVDANLARDGVVNVLARDGLGMPAGDAHSMLGKRTFDSIQVWTGANEAVNKVYGFRLNRVKTLMGIQDNLGLLTMERKKCISNSIERIDAQWTTCETLLDSIYIKTASQTGEIMDVQTALSFMPIDIPQMVERLGYTVTTGDLSSIGTKLKAAYVAKYGRVPPFEIEKVLMPNGSEDDLPVNQYFEKDSDVVEDVIHAFYARKADVVQQMQLAEELKAEKAATKAAKREAAKMKKDATAKAREEAAEKKAQADKQKKEKAQKKKEEAAEKKAQLDKQKEEKAQKKKEEDEAKKAAKRTQKNTTLPGQCSLMPFIATHAD